MIKNRVHILMERMKNPNIVGYEVLASDLQTGIQKRVAIIPNPKNINPIKIRTRLENSRTPRSDIYSRIYNLKHKSIVVDADYGVKVVINGEEVERDLYVLNEYNSQLIIYIVTSEQDDIEIEYYIDGIEYEFISENDQKYVVKPMIDENNAFIGRHNILI